MAFVKDDDMKISIPTGVAEIIHKLAARGFEAYVVGGCVRDCLMGRAAQDWDITTNARPAEIKAVFAQHKMVDIGERHGTVAVNAAGKHYEVTTYRVDGDYSDGRRPDAVSFTHSLKEDLRRRDFTINAMAYSVESGLVDYFGGREDLNQKVVRCVGNATQRLSEDYLRIMRAYRFAATLGFSLSSEVRRAAKQNCESLHAVAPERLRTEFVKILLSDNFDKIEMFFEDCGSVLFPEIMGLADFEQNNPYHCHDVLRHSFFVLRQTPADAAMRFAALYHDTGKLHTRTTDDAGIHHFRGHESVSCKIAGDALARLRFDNNTAKRVLTIIKHHDAEFGAERSAIKHMLYKFGPDMTRDILKFQAADNMAKTERAREGRLKRVLAAAELLEDIISSGEPVKISDLAISGTDVMKELNISSGSEVGEHLQHLMEEVLVDPTVNTREFLIELLHKSPKAE